MKRLYILLPLVAVTLSACGHLTDAGSAVTLYRGDSIRLVDHCKRIGVVKAESVVSRGKVQAELRNQAGAMGADSVAMVNSGFSGAHYYSSGVAYLCNQKAPSG